MKKTFLLILIIIITISCSKDDASSQEIVMSNDTLNNSPEGQEEIENNFTNPNLLKSIAKNGVIINELKYNSDEKIQSRNYYYDDGSLWLKDSIQYIGDTVSIKNFDSMNELISVRKFYPKQELNLHQFDLFDEDLNLISYRLYVKGENTCGFDDIKYLSPETEEINWNIKYIYLDDICSYNEIWYTSNQSKRSEIVVTSDGKNSYRKFLNLDLFNGNSIGQGNVLELNVISTTAGFSDTYSSYFSEFEYDSNNFPIYEKRIYETQPAIEFSYEYY